MDVEVVEEDWRLLKAQRVRDKDVGLYCREDRWLWIGEERLCSGVRTCDREGNVVELVR